MKKCVDCGLRGELDLFFSGGVNKAPMSGRVFRLKDGKLRCLDCSLIYLRAISKKTRDELGEAECYG